MRFITAFFMAWGNFITLPCPYKKWDGKLKNMMLAFLPSVGAVVGALWVVITWLLAGFIHITPVITVIVAEFYIFYIHGFMHLDGFMDTTDAIMSRRPLEERQRIMKDSNVGSFAVVMVAFLLIFWFALLFKLISAESTAVLGAMFLIPVVSRGFSGSYVLTYSPIGHSQYVENEHDPERGKCKAGLIVQLIIYIAAVEAVYYAIGNVRMMLSTLVMCVIEAVVSFIACAHGRKQLGGISGDIAGYTIVWSELAAVAALVIATDIRCFGGMRPWY